MNLNPQEYCNDKLTDKTTFFTKNDTRPHRKMSVTKMPMMPAIANFFGVILLTLSISALMFVLFGPAISFIKILKNRFHEIRTKIRRPQRNILSLLSQKTGVSFHRK